MAITSVGYDGSITEVQWAKMIASVGSSDYGVAGINDWLVTGHPTTAQAVNIATGSGWGSGVYDTSDTVVTVQCPVITSGTRYDLIVANRNWQGTGGLTTFTYVQGTSVRALPVYAKNPGVQEAQPLALVLWTAGQTQPTAVVDLRCWVGPGGLVAKDTLALSYLNLIGTEVMIGNDVWQSTIGLSGTVSWTKSSTVGKIPMLAVGGVLDGGNAVPTDGMFLIQSGTTVQTFDASGYARITWPKPFPTGLVACWGFNGDGVALPNAFFSSSGRIDIWGSEANGNKTSWVYTATGQQTDQWLSSTAVGGKLHRINWVAIGF